MYLVITIDTEEDNWGDYSPMGHTCGNIERIPALQEVFDEFDVKPTYLITYPVATDERSMEIFKGIHGAGKCEIGAHCHPWNTPPFDEEMSPFNSMLCNLPTELQYRKMKTLHETIITNLGIAPASFKAGRWGFNDEVAANLDKLGYKVDSSIASFTDWTPYHGPDYSDTNPVPFRLSTGTNGEGIIEVPATVGYLQGSASMCNSFYKAVRRSFLGRVGLIGILYRLKLLNKVWLSPEISNSKEMIGLTRRMLKKRYDIVNLTFHSSSLEAGLTPIIKDESERREFMNRIRAFLSFARDNGIASVKLSEVPELI